MNQSIDSEKKAVTNSTKETKQPQHLKRVLGFRSLLAVAIGLVVSQSVMVMILQGVGIGGLGFFMPLTIAFFLAISYAFSFSELTLMLPRAGSLSVYTDVAIGPLPAMVATYAGYVVVAMFALSAELLLVDLILRDLFPEIFSPMIVATGILLVFTWLNIIGVDIFAKLQSLLAFSMVVALLILGGTALTDSGLPRTFEIDLFQDWNPAGVEVFSLIAIAIWGFVGAEFVCPMVEESKSPEKNIPRSMITSICIIMAIYVIYCLGAIFYVPLDVLSSSALPHKDFVFAVFGERGTLFLATAAVTATCSTVNTCLAAIPRMIYGMAHNGQAISALQKIHPKYQTPWIAVIFIALITGLPLLVLGNDAESVKLLLISASLAWLLAYIVVHIDVMVLRKRMPNASRPFKTPFYPWPQVIGILGMIYAAMHNSPSPELTQKVYMTSGVVILIVVVMSTFWLKVIMKKELFKPKSFEHALEE
ncbi:MAG: APC family permease [Gammaproteobacteria bacterium]